MTITVLHLLATVAALGFPLTHSANLDGVFNVCSRSDPKLNQCIVDSLNGAKGHLAQGVPEVGLPPFSPFVIADLPLHDLQSEQLHLRIRNFTWNNLADFEATSAKMDLAKSTLDLEMYWKSTWGTGNFIFEGQLFALPMKGEGNFYLKVDGINGTQRIQFEEVKRDGVTHWRPKRWTMELGGIQTVRSEIKFLRNNQQLNQFTSAFVNNNWRAILRDFSQQIHAGVGQFLMDTTQEFFERVPLDNLLAP